MKLWLRGILISLLRKITPPPRDLRQENKFLRDTLNELVTTQFEQMQRAQDSERLAELVEARAMAGSGPWQVSAQALQATDSLIDESVKALKSGTRLRETSPLASAGASGDIEFALQNVEWRREINLSWLEFSRWGIQQLILISRLHYVKNPWIQRAINVSAQYVFGRGVEVMSEDPKAHEVLSEFFERNKRVVGQAALSDLQKRLGYDGQIFFVFFADKVDKGKTTVRTIDATEIFEIVTDQDDTDTPWLYNRKWTAKTFDQQTGAIRANAGDEAWYPAINYDPDVKPELINGKRVMWEQPVLHFKGGTGVAKWHFDCPKAYAALDWAKAGRRWLESCATVRAALAQIALVLTTKGGQQALEGAKQQLQTTIGPTSNLWDSNPPAIAGSTFASGPGTTLAAFNTKGAGGDPSDVREYRSMVACVFEIPPTFLGDLETANLATATTLDRPTELAMLEKQERWREVLTTMAVFVLNVDKGAPSGRLSESKDLRVVECARRTLPNGRRVYEASKPNPKQIEIKVNFPAIREGDLPANVKAITEAMTLDNKGGQVVGIDEKVGVGLLYEQFGVENYGDILDKQYPDGEYDPDRTIEPLPAPIGKAEPDPGGLPQAPGGKDPKPQDKKVAAAESAVMRFLEALKNLGKKAA